MPPAAVAEGLLSFDGSWPALTPTLQHGQMDSDPPAGLSPAAAFSDAAAPWRLPDSAPQQAAAAALLDPHFVLTPALTHTRQDDAAAGGWSEQPQVPRRSCAASIVAGGRAAAWDERWCASLQPQWRKLLMTRRPRCSLRLVLRGVRCVAPPYCYLSGVRFRQFVLWQMGWRPPEVTLSTFPCRPQRAE